MRRISRYKIAKKRCFVIKYQKDNRYEQFSPRKVVNHSFNCIDSDNSALHLMDCMGKIKLMDPCVIAVDEGQFFLDIIEFSQEIVKMGKTLIISALDGTFEMKPFNDICNLIPMCESVLKLNAICHICSGDAAFTKRLDPTNHAIEVIGGINEYIACCRTCYYGCADKENIFS